MTDLVAFKELEIVTALTKHRDGDKFAIELYSDNLTVELSTMKPNLRTILNQGTAKGDMLKTIYEIASYKLRQLGDRGKLSEDETRAFCLDWLKLRDADTLEDLILMFDMGRRGEFGKVYGGLDVMTLNEWVQKYMDHKYSVVESMHKRSTEPYEKAALISEKLHKQITQTDE